MEAETLAQADGYSDPMPAVHSVVGITQPIAEEQDRLDDAEFVCLVFEVVQCLLIALATKPECFECES